MTESFLLVIEKLATSKNGNIVHSIKIAQIN